MVSLEHRLTYLSGIEGQPKLGAFYNFIYGKPIAYPPKDSLNETDIIYYNIIESILNDSRSDFEKSYQQISKRKPTENSQSPFIHDDFLVLVLILGVKKFNLEESWVQGVINLRSRNAIKITFDNLLNENYNSNSNIAELVVIYLSIYNQSLIKPELLERTYMGITSKMNLFESQSDLLILSAIRAYDTIIEYKTSADGSEIYFLKGFEKSFLKRVGIIAWVLYNLTLLLILYGVAQLLYLLPEQIVDKLNIYAIILGIIGVGVIGGNLIRELRLWFRNLIYYVLGYNSDVIKKIRDK